MKKSTVAAVCCLLVAASCGTDTGGGTSSDSAPPPTTPAEVQPEPTEAPVPTEAPAPTDTPAPAPTEAPAPETTEAPSPPVQAVGLVPLPGVQLDFTAQTVQNPSLVWSLYSGSGGVIVENVGEPIPAGCHGVSFFDPQTFDLLQVDGKDAMAYATRGDGGCDGMQQDLEDGFVDGDAVKVNDDNLIMFDFGALPPPPFDVSTQIVEPSGANGIFRSANPDAQLFVNEFPVGTTHVVGANLYELGDDGLLTYVSQPQAQAGPGCAEFTACFQNGRFQVELSDAEGNPGTLLTGGDASGLFFFVDPDNWNTLVHVLDGCEFNNHFWVFAASTTDVEYTLTVTDTANSSSQTYSNPLGTPSGPILDTEAFATCP